MKQTIIFMILTNIICISSYKKNLKLADVNDLKTMEVTSLEEINVEVDGKFIDGEIVGSGEWNDILSEELEESENKPEHVKKIEKGKPESQWSCKQKAKEGYRCLSAAICPASRDLVEYTCKYPRKVCCKIGTTDD